MTPDEYTSLALRTESDIPPRMLTEQEWRLLHATLGLADEVGELAKQMKGCLFYGKPMDVVNVGEELGDISGFWNQAIHAVGQAIAKVGGVDINKLQVRLPEKFTADAASRRDWDAARRAS